MLSNPKINLRLLDLMSLEPDPAVLEKRAHIRENLISSVLSDDLTERVTDLGTPEVGFVKFEEDPDASLA